MLTKQKQKIIPRLPKLTQPYLPIEKAMQQGRISKDLLSETTGMGNLPAPEKFNEKFNYATSEQVSLLKKFKAEGTLGLKQLTTPLWLQAKEARELGYSVPEGQTEYLLQPTVKATGELYGGIPEPTSWLTPELALMFEDISPVLERLDPGFLDRGTISQPLISGLYKEIGGEETSRFLKLLGVSEGDILNSLDAVQQNERVTNTIQAVFPDFEIEDLSDMLETDFEDFIKGIQTGGSTFEKRQLLEQLGFMSTEIDTLLGNDLQGLLRFDTTKPESFRDLLRLGGVSEDEIEKIIVQQGKPPELKPSIWHNKAVASFVAGIGDILSTSGGAARWLGYEGAGEYLSDLSVPFHRAEIFTRPDTLGEFDAGDLLNPDFYMTKLVRPLPFSLAILPVALAGYFSGGALAGALGLGKIGAWILGGLGYSVLSRPLESAMEAGGAYDDAIARGKTEAEAKKEADEVFKNNMTLAGADAFEIAIALAPTPKWVPASLVKQGLARVIQIGGKAVIVGLSEGGEEVYQDMIQRHARGEEWKLDPVSKEVFAIGAAMGIGMGLGGDVITNVVGKTEAEMPNEMKQGFNRNVSDFIAAGIPIEEARLKALNNVAQTQEGQSLISKIIRDERGSIGKQGELERLNNQIAIVRQDLTEATDISKQVQLRNELNTLEKQKRELTTPAPEVTKQPWQMTKSEYVKWRQEEYHKTFPEAKGFKPSKTPYIERTPAGYEHEQSVKQAISEGKLVPPEVLKEYPDLVAIPKAEVGMPEAGLQPSMIPEEIAGKEVRPKGKGRVTQVSMEDQLKLEQARGVTGEKGINLAIQEAKAEVASSNIGQLQIAKQEIETELGNRSMPFHGGAKAGAYSGYTSKQLDEMLNVYDGALAKVPPPPPPPQSVTPPPIPVEPQPTGTEITRIIEQSKEQVRQDKAGNMTKLFQKIPGLRQVLEFEQPGLKMTGENEKVLVAMVAENAARSDVSVWATGTRLRLLRDIRHAFGKDAVRGEKTNAKFIGTPEQAKSPITGTLKDIADNPELYELSNEQQGVLSYMEARNDQLLGIVVDGYNAEIGRFQANVGGAFLPNVDVSEDVIEYLGSEMRAVSIGRGKTRIWQTARDRMAGKTPFKPELDVQKLLEGLDSFKASAAGGMTYRQAIGGLTRDEAIAKTHPELGKRMNTLKENLQKLRNARDASAGIKRDIDAFIQSAKEDIDLEALSDGLATHGEELQQLIDSAKIQRAGYLEKVKELNSIIRNIRKEIADLRSYWKSANIKPYVFIQEGLFRYFPADQANLIRESRQVTNNPALNFIERWRGQAFSGDFSPFTIQGVNGVLADPWGSLQAALGGVRTAIQEHDFLRSVKIEALADDIANNPNEWSQFASLMGRGLTGTPREYAAGFLSKIPGFDRFTESTYITITRGSFNLWQRTYNNMVKHGVPELEAKVAAAAHTAKVYPLVSAVRLGQSQARQAFLRAVPTSYSFIRQPASLMAEAVNGIGKIMIRQSLTAQESLAVKTVIIGGVSTMGVCATSAALSAAAQGGDADDIKDAIWDAINPDPHNGKFLSIIVGNIRIPLGGPYRAIFRAVYPQEVKGSPIPLPFVGIGRYLRNRVSPAIGTQLELALNKDWSGQQIIKGDFPENVLRFFAYEFENFLPLTAGAGVEAVRQGEKYKENIFQQMIGQFMGVNPVTLDNTYLDRQIRKLGLPKDTEPKPYSIQEPDLYTTKDLYGDASWTRDLTVEDMEQQDFDQKIISIAKARGVKKQLDLLPDTSLIKINADPAKGDTFFEYAEQWQMREKITDEDKLEEFDNKYPKANLGNMTANEYVLLQRYHNLSGKEQIDFLKQHPELGVDVRIQALRDNPKENALLAVWGQTKLYTKEAYTEFKRLIDELDIPDSAISEMTLPPEGSVDNYFKYEEMDNKNSWEAQLMLAQDEDLVKFLDRQSIDTPIASLELKVKNRANFDAYEELKTEEERKQYKLDNPKFVEDTRRIEAIEKGTNDTPTPNDIVEAWVDRGKTVDEFTAGSSEAKVWLIDHKDVWDWALNNGLLTDDGKDWNENVLRLNVKMNQLEEDSEEYFALKRQEQGYSEGFTQIDDFSAYYELPAKGFRQERYLLEHPEFAVEMERIKGITVPDYIPPVLYDELLEKKDKTPEDLLTIRGYDNKVPQEYINSYVDYYALARPDNWQDRTGTDKWYEDDWFLIENQDFYQDVYLNVLGNQKKDFRKVPTREVFNQYINGYLKKPEGKARDDYRFKHLELDAWLVSAFGYTPILEKKRRAGLTPLEKTKESIFESEKEWQEQLDALERMLERIK